MGGLAVLENGSLDWQVGETFILDFPGLGYGMYVENGSLDWQVGETFILDFPGLGYSMLHVCRVCLGDWW
jgi:hypothetical protein